MTDAEMIKLRSQLEAEWVSLQDLRRATAREVDYWKCRYDSMLKLMADQASMYANPPVQLMELAEPQSYEAGRKSGALQEREACAQLCEEALDEMIFTAETAGVVGALKCHMAKLIRARGIA